MYKNISFAFALLLISLTPGCRKDDSMTRSCVTVVTPKKSLQDISISDLEDITVDADSK